MKYFFLVALLLSTFITTASFADGPKGNLRWVEIATVQPMYGMGTEYSFEIDRYVEAVELTDLKGRPIVNSFQLVTDSGEYFSVNALTGDINSYSRTLYQSFQYPRYVSKIKLNAESKPFKKAGLFTIHILVYVEDSNGSGWND